MEAPVGFPKKMNTLLKNIILDWICALVLYSSGGVYKMLTLPELDAILIKLYQLTYNISRSSNTDRHTRYPLAPTNYLQSKPTWGNMRLPEQRNVVWKSPCRVEGWSGWMGETQDPRPGDCGSLAKVWSKVNNDLFWLTHVICIT